MSHDPRRELGAAGERAVLAGYLRAGYVEVARNWRCRLGEIDLIVARPGLMVFCEVKTRSSDAFGGGWQAVTARKRATLRRVATAFLAARAEPAPRIRFDVASVDRRGDALSVELFEDAF